MPLFNTLWVGRAAAIRAGCPDSGDLDAAVDPADLTPEYRSALADAAARGGSTSKPVDLPPASWPWTRLAYDFGPQHGGELKS